MSVTSEDYEVVHDEQQLHLLQSLHKLQLQQQQLQDQLQQQQLEPHPPQLQQPQLHIPQPRQPQPGPPQQLPQLQPQLQNQPQPQKLQPHPPNSRLQQHSLQNYNKQSPRREEQLLSQLQSQLQQLQLKAFDNNVERGSIYRTVFNADFFKEVGFITKRAAEAMITLYSDIQKICDMSVSKVTHVIMRERHKVYAYIRTTHMLNVEKANALDEEVSKKLKETKIERYIARSRRDDIERNALQKSQERSASHESSERNAPQEPQEHSVLHDERNAPQEQRVLHERNASHEHTALFSKGHSYAIMRICQSDPHNPISVKIMSYLKDNKLITL